MGCRIWFLWGILMVVIASVDVYSQSAVKSGIQGQILIDQKLSTAKYWPMNEDETKKFEALSVAVVRRQSPYGRKASFTQMKPMLQWVLEGVSQKNPKPVKVVLENLSFNVPHLLIVSSKSLTVKNNQVFPITLVFNGKQKKRIAAGKSAEIVLLKNDSTLTIEELPFVALKIKLLEKALKLEVDAHGKIHEIKVEGGEYRLAAYWGAEKKFARSLVIPESEYVAIIARISENIGITVEIKKGGLRRP